ncbi:MAG: ATP synthase F1 subunit gamma [Acetilactobacillus jinshanensis]
MASTKDVKERIGATKRTQQITTAMEMVSTAKLNRIKHHTKPYNDYASKVKAVVSHLAQSHLLDKLSSSSDSKSKHSTGKVAYLVITSDRGMVGSYNSNVIRGTNAFIQKHTPNSSDYLIIAVGGNGADFYKKRGVNVAYENLDVSDIPTYSDVKGIISTIHTMYKNHIFSKLYVCYDHFVNQMVSKFRAEQMLPMDSKAFAEGKSKNLKSSESPRITPEYEIEPDESTIAKVVIPQYVESLIFGAILDGKTSEHASGSNAMRSASNNADDLVSKLQLAYNRARQAAITTELTEIVGGQEALKH